MGWNVSLSSILGVGLVVGIGVGVTMFGRAKSAPEPKATVMVDSSPIDVVVQAVEVMPHERREGMRRVRVSVRSGDGKVQETITEWVPVVLLGHLTIGARVQLIVDPTLNQWTVGL